MNRYVVTYTSTNVIVIEAKDRDAAERRAMSVLTGGAVMPAKRDVTIESVVKS